MEITNLSDRTIIEYEDSKIIIGNNIINDINKYVSIPAQMVFVITDVNVNKLYKNVFYEKINIHHKIVLKASETSKSQETYYQVIEELLSNGITRDSIIIGFGGGVVLDLAGFVSATLFRGLKYINIPTTLVAQIDSAVGGKTGINFLGKKNLIGTFYIPEYTLIDKSFLKTLDTCELISGMGELLKIALISDYQLFIKIIPALELIDKAYDNNFSSVFLEMLISKKTRIIESAIINKMKFVVTDIYDEGKRKMLNFGHTFAHAIEAVSNFEIPHGLAVLYGVQMALIFGVDIGLTPLKIQGRIEALLLPKSPYKLEELVMYFKYDKKRSNTCMQIVLLEDYEKPVFHKLIINE